MADEHGPRGGDEINIPQKGKNYAGRWQPGESTIQALRYRRRKGDRRRDRATCFLLERFARRGGMAFYNSDKFPQWQQKLFIAR